MPDKEDQAIGMIEEIIITDVHQVDNLFGWRFIIFERVDELNLVRKLWNRMDL